MAVELVRVGEQIEVGIDVSQPAGEVVLDGCEFCGELVALPRNVVESCLDLGDGELSVRCEIEEVLLFDVELLDLGLQLFAEQALGVDLVGNGGLELSSNGGDELWAEADRLVVLLDGALDAVDVGVWRITHVLLDAAAEEVVVFLAVPAGGALQDHALDDAVFESTASAPDGSLEVVLVLDAALAGLVAGVEQRLDGLEELDIDDRIVPSVVRLTLVLDLAEVVAIAQHTLHLGYRDRSRGTSCSWPGGKAAVGEFCGDVLERVVPGGVELEGELHERRALSIYCDRPDFAPVDALEGVQVADRRSTEGAAVLGLLPHLVGDVGTVFA